MGRFKQVFHIRISVNYNENPNPGRYQAHLKKNADPGDKS